MTKARTAWMVAAAGVVGLALSLPVAASAQPYPGEQPPVVDSETLAREVPTQTQVLGETLARKVPTQVLGETVSRGDTLPLTGGDVLGLTAFGIGAIATGAVLVRRSRARTA